MKKFKKLLVFIIIILLVIILVITFKKIDNKDNSIKDGYIAVFNGGVGEIVYSTYVYKIDNGKANYGFEYINVTKTTKYWGSSEWNVKITDRGKVEWTDDVFEKAEENGAYSYVLLPNSDKTYTIEEYRNMFLMN